VAAPAIAPCLVARTLPCKAWPATGYTMGAWVYVEDFGDLESKASLDSPVIRFVVCFRAQIKSALLNKRRDFGFPTNPPLALIVAQAGDHRRRWRNWLHHRVVYSGSAPVRTRACLCPCGLRADTCARSLHFPRVLTSMISGPFRTSKCVCTSRPKICKSSTSRDLVLVAGTTCASHITRHCSRFGVASCVLRWLVVVSALSPATVSLVS